MSRKIYLGFLVLAAVCLLLGGCKKKEPKLTNESSTSGTKNEPTWVTKCAGAFEDSGKEAFYGCGSVSGIQNVSFQIQTSDARARADLAKVIDTYVASFFKDYLSSSAISGKTGLDTLEEEQFVESITKEITEVSLYGVQIIDHWRAPDGTLYSLARVSFDNIAESMRKQMAERTKELKIDADQALKELDEQLKKRQESGK